MCRQDSDHRAGVVQLAMQNGLVRLIKIDPADRHAVFLGLANEQLMVVDVDELPGQEDAKRFGVASRRAEIVNEDVPTTGDEVSLLVQLAGRAEPRLLPCDVEQPGRQLPLERTDRVAVLLDEQHLIAAIDLAKGNDRDGTRVVDVLAGDLAGVTEVDDVAPDVPDHSVEYERRVGDGAPVEPVSQICATEHRGVQTHCTATVSVPLGLSTSTRRDALWELIAASTNPAKSGCARSGRDLNSGWAWVET